MQAKSQHIRPSVPLVCLSALFLSFVNDHANDGLDQMYSAFYGHIYSIRPAKHRTTYLGCFEVSPNRFDHERIQTTYIINPKAAMEIIRPHVNASAKPSPAHFTVSIRQHNHPTTFINGAFNCPINTGPAFCFRPPTNVKIISCLGKRDKSSPGQNGISYQDILLTLKELFVRKFLPEFLKATLSPPIGKHLTLL